MKLLPESFKSINSPVLPNVKIVEEWNRYDGPLYGICEVLGEKFFFDEVIWDMWRWYSYDPKSDHGENDDCERLWRIYAVYDIELEKLNFASKKHTCGTREKINQALKETNVIGIFWEYEDGV